jgi:hypothetical protein
MLNRKIYVRIKRVQREQMPQCNVKRTGRTAGPWQDGRFGRINNGMGRINLN